MKAKNKTIQFMNMPLRSLFIAAAILAFGFGALSGGASAQETTKPDGARVTEEESCKKYNNQAQKNACEEGYGAALGDNKVLSPQKDYPKEEEADANQMCVKYKVQDNLNACKTGYKDGHYAYYHKSSTDPVAKAQNQNASVFETGAAKHKCGNTPDAVKTKFDFGCLGDKAPKNTGPIQDLLFSIIRFLSVGVGVVLVLSMVYAGIQYSTSEGSAEATQAAKDRIRNTVIGLFIYLFAFSLIQYLVPGGVFSVTTVLPPELARELIIGVLR